MIGHVVENEKSLGFNPSFLKETQEWGRGLAGGASVFSVCTMTTHVDLLSDGKKELGSLAGWLSWLEHRPIHQRAVGSVPSQGTYLGCGFNPWQGTYKRQLTGFSLTSMSVCLSVSLSKSINISSGEDLKKRRGYVPRSSGRAETMHSVNSHALLFNE